MSVRKEILKRIKDLEDPIRYGIFSDIANDKSYRLWLDISDDTYGMDISHATLFKNPSIAEAVFEAVIGTVSEASGKTLRIAKLTTANGKRKVLRVIRPLLPAVNNKVAPNGK